MTDVHFLTQSDGWAVTRTDILRTADGGSSWTQVTPPTQQPPGGFYWTGFFASSEVAWVVHNPKNVTQLAVLFKTVDGGKTWSSVSVPVYGDASIRFETTQNGAMLVNQGAGAGSCVVTLLRSADGGENWAIVASTHPDTATYPGGGLGCGGGASFADADNGWVTGGTAGNVIPLLHSTDGGKTWSEQAIAIPKGFSAAEGAAASYDPTFFGRGDGVLPVSFRQQGFDLYRTSDQGQIWTPSTPVRFASPATFSAYSVINGQHAVVTGGNEIYITADGGSSWHKILPNMSLANASEIDFVDPSDGWALVPDPHHIGSVLLVTHNGGATWKQVD